MDYVVFGIGMGASLVLFGLAGRAIGPSLRYRRSRDNEEVLKGEELVARVAWGRFCGSLGAALTIAGIFLILVTAISIAVRVSDGAGTVIVVVSLLAIIALMVLWTWAYIGRFGLYGIAAERPKSIEHGPLRSYEQPDDDEDLDFMFAKPAVQNAAPTKSANGSVPAVAYPVRSQPIVNQPQPENPSEPVPQEEQVLAGPERPASINQSDADVLDRILREPHSTPSPAASSYFFAEPYVEPESESAADEEQDQPEEIAEHDADDVFYEDQEASGTSDDAELARRDHQ